MKKFAHFQKELNILSRIERLLEWDQETTLPSQALEYRAEELGHIAVKYHKIITSRSFEKAIKQLKNGNKLSRKSYKLYKREIEENRSLPKEFIDEQATTQSNSLKAWHEARNKNDYSLFEPWLEKLLILSRKYGEYLGEDPYKSLLDQYDDSLSINKMSDILSELKDGLINTLRKININKISCNLNNFDYPAHLQQQAIKELLELIGIDFNRCALGTTIHPFQTTISYHDKRIAMSYAPKNIINTILTAMHEGGHCLYEQGMAKKLANTCLHDSPSMSFHESQSRFYETIIGQSAAFWDFYKPILAQYFPIINYTNVDEIYSVVNNLEPSIIRIESDELRYNLHIIIRFELERDLLEGTVTTKQLPEKWNEKYWDYLKLVPSNLKEGVLQDIHWADGSFGYFPTYAVGNILAGMFRNKIVNETNINLNNITTTTLSNLRNWLKENVHQYGAIYSSKKLTKKIFKESLTSKYYLKYLNEKYLNS